MNKKETWQRVLRTKRVAKHRGAGQSRDFQTGTVRPKGQRSLKYIIRTLLFSTPST